MIALADLVIEEGKFKKEVVVPRERYGVHYDSNETEDLTDEKAWELWEALRNLDLRAAPPGYAGFKSDKH
jgi:hypothetical protein